VTKPAQVCGLAEEVLRRPEAWTTITVPTVKGRAYIETMQIVGRAEMMSEIVTVPERKAREAARRRAAARDVMAEASKFAAARGGRFYVFGSVAEDRMKYDSDFDVVVDFPAAAETEAAEFVEEACRRRDLPSDVHLKSRATDQFLHRISDRMVILP
jgi:predicted nucleotidyltransferase